MFGGSSMAGPKIDQPEIRSNVAAQASDLDGVSSFSLRVWQWSQLFPTRSGGSRRAGTPNIGSAAGIGA